MWTETELVRLADTVILTAAQSRTRESRHLPNGSAPMSQSLDPVRIVLAATSHPGNIGSAARAMRTMGLSSLVLVNPRRFPDPEATALASGATDVLEAARVVGTIEEALAGCVLTVGLSARPREFAGRVLPVRAAATAALSHVAQGDVAFLFGSEMSGLSNAELAQCGAVATIPSDPGYGSLNVAAAVQVMAYELRVAALGDEVWRAPRFEPATHDEIAALYRHGKESLTALRFLNPQRPKRLLPRLQRLFARAGLEKEEVNILRGILTRVDELVARGPRS